MSGFISNLFGGSNRAQAEAAAQQQQVAAQQQRSLQQQEQARVDVQAGKMVKNARGRRLLLDGAEGGSDLAATVG